MKTIPKITLILFLITYTTVQAQFNKDQRSKRIEALKIGFLTEKLELTEKEATLFWPIYNSYNLQIREISKKQRELFRKVVVTNSLSEKEAKNIIYKDIQFDSQEESLKLEFFKKLEGILTYNKILKLHLAEREFKKHLFERLRNGRGKRN